MKELLKIIDMVNYGIVVQIFSHPFTDLLRKILKTKHWFEKKKDFAVLK